MALHKRLTHWIFLALGLLILPCSIDFAYGSAQVSATERKGLQVLEEIQDAITHLAEEVKATVVNISPIRERGRPKNFPREQGQDSPGTGSGFIISEDGFVVTNSHVIGEAPEAEIRLSDKTKLTAHLVGRDPDTDLALLKIDTDRSLPPAKFGDSSQVKVGQWVLAVGNPFGLDRTVTLGVVSGIGRENMNLSRYENFIQTDASINPGNSGGPLFNLRGEVIGINTAIINFAQGIGFAIPSEMATRVIGQLKSRGKVIRGWLGVGIQPVTAELANKFGGKEGQGVLINEVFENEPADKAGLKSGDIITKIDGKSVETPNQLSRVIAGIDPGEMTRIEIIRDGEALILGAALGERQDRPIVASLPSQQEEEALGIDVQTLTPDLAEKFKLEERQGVLISKVERGSFAHTEGLREGDLIKEVNRVEVPTVRQFSEEIKKVDAGETILLRVIRKARAFYVVLKPQG